ncbi:hypothetical protein K4K49_010945 [Colletotrichum sp. SAR 10_70]|nr:hypothetical protein K4K50_012297 [Colletotrichum sp. SAR 10_71]KAI8202514.1 hypothetical protein K4K49_010945 [Colletotrichum sp. SAR 10_70]
MPNELRLQILGYLAHEDGDRASYGSVCRQWLQIMEPYIFEDITFYVTNASVLSGSHTPQKLVAALRQPRLKYLKTLRLVVDIDLFTFTSIYHAHSQPRRMPMLKSVDLWGDYRNIMHPDLEEDEITPLDAHFQCTIDEKFVTAVFKTTGESQPDDSVRDAWRAMAEQRSRQLRFEVEQVDVLDYTQPFTTPAVEDFFNRHIYVDEDSLYYRTSVEAKD